MGASGSSYSERNSALAAIPLKSAAMAMTTWMVAANSCCGSVSARKPDGLVVVSRHGVRRQFPSSTHDFAKYAPGKTFATEDQVCVEVQRLTLRPTAEAFYVLHYTIALEKNIRLFSPQNQNQFSLWFGGGSPFTCVAVRKDTTMTHGG